MDQSGELDLDLTVVMHALADILAIVHWEVNTDAQNLGDSDLSAFNNGRKIWWRHLCGVMASNLYPVPYIRNR